MCTSFLSEILLLMVSYIRSNVGVPTGFVVKYGTRSSVCCTSLRILSKSLGISYSELQM